jgi:hypothetical protein
VLDYHARQLTGSTCGSRNCAAASAAMGINAATAGTVELTSDDVRRLSGASCVPGAHSGSGGLYISDVIRVGRLFSVEFDYGRDPVSYYKRWSESEGVAKLSSGYGGVILGDYDQVPAPYRVSTSFMGDHSTWVHDLRAGAVCWHDPLRATPIRLPLDVLLRYWQKSGSPIRGYAGWVKDTRIVPKPKVSIRRLTAWWRYYKVGSSWRRSWQLTRGGFTAECTAPERLVIMGRSRRVVRTLTGAYGSGAFTGTYIDLDAFGVRYRED